MTTAGRDGSQAPFRHGVASGDALDDRVVIWTRLTVDTHDDVPVRWWLSTDDGRPVADGRVNASRAHDHTVHVDVTGLSPATAYQYGFEALGVPSRVGRTRTLPGAGGDHVRFAQVSCAKFNAGFFNAYARIADRNDLDFVLHLGDYIYEASQTPPASQTPGADIGRPFDPAHECKSLDDYRRRYAQYRDDPDLQALHARHPLIATWDDHEFADGAWRDGAAEHHEERDGPWSDRRKRAIQARWEWLPARPPDPGDLSRVFRVVPIGSLADLIVIDTRTRRDEPVPPDRDHPGRSALGAEQRAWLAEALAASRAEWRLVGNPSVMARTWRDDLPDWVRAALVKVKLIDADQTGPDWDQWDGYPAERRWLLERLRDTPRGNVVVLSGDVHVGMVDELRIDELDGEPVAVEFVNTSVTSQNLDDKMGWTRLTRSLGVAEALLGGMPHVHWCDLDSHGYTLVDVTPERVAAEWWAVDTVLERTGTEELVAAWEVAAGSTMPMERAAGAGAGGAPTS